MPKSSTASAAAAAAVLSTLLFGGDGTLASEPMRLNAGQMDAVTAGEALTVSAATAVAVGFSRSVALTDTAAVTILTGGTYRQTSGEADPSLGLKDDPVTDFETLCRPGESAPVALVDALDEVERDVGHVAVALADTFEGRWDHLRVVDDEGIARRQQGRQVGDDAILEDGRRCPPLPLHPIRRTHDEHPRRIARFCRAQCNQAVGQIEVEKLGAHASGSFAVADTVTLP